LLLPQQQCMPCSQSLLHTTDNRHPDIDRLVALIAECLQVRRNNKNSVLRHQMWRQHLFINMRGHSLHINQARTA
jgi:hypothetical protein